MKTLIALLCCLCTPLFAASPIPSSRTMNWGRTNVGVIGGIPTNQVRYTNITYTGDMDYGDTFRTALLNCPSNQYVFVNPGTYTVGGNFDYFDLGNGKVLKGAGDYRTRILLTNGYIYVRTVAFDEPKLTNSVNLALDAAKGSSQITLASIPSWMVVGGTYILDQVGDTNVVYAYGTSENENPTYSYRDGQIWLLYNQIPFTAETNHYENRGMGTMILVTNIVGNVIQLEQPLNYTWQVSKTGQVATAGYFPSQAVRATRIGFEDLTFEQTFENGGVDMFVIEGNQIWWKNCTFTNSAGLRHMQFAFSYRCEVQNCWIDTSRLYSSGKGYGFSLYHLSTSCLLENSVLRNLHGPISLNYGANNTVAINNVVTKGQSDSGQNPSITTHGVHCFGNLAEGNYFVDKILNDYSHGSASHNGYFRNRVLGYDGVHVADQNVVVTEFYNRSNFFVGNSLGVTGWHTNVLATATNIYCDSTTRDIYHLGYFTYGCGYGSNNFDAPAVNKALLAVNWNSVDQALVLGGFTTNDLPSSLVYGSTPPYWPAGRTWPIDILGNPNGFTNLPSFDKLYQRTNSFGPPVVKATAVRFRIE